jgi:putative transposase
VSRLCGWSPELRGQARNLGVPKTLEIQFKQGCWYASITLATTPQRISGEKAIGIDWGLETFATISSSNNSCSAIQNPRTLRKKLKLLKSKQQSLSKKKLGSNNRKRARQQVAKIHRTVANQRKEFLHQTTNRLVRESALIAIEQLNIKEMTASGGAYKKGLNREILSTSPSRFHQMLKYKAEEAGVEWVEIPTKTVKPSQTCHGCGRQEKKPLSMRKHSCLCGVVCGRDENAAKVILNWALYGNATGQELAWCGVEALVSATKHETLPITAEAV